MASVTRARLWARRIGYLAAAAAAGLLIHVIVDERSYAHMAASAARADARIVRVEEIPARGGRKPSHAVHYEIRHGGEVRVFSDEHGANKLADFYRGSWDVFEGPDPRVAPGKTIPVLVVPNELSDHRADREHLPYPWLLWLDNVLSVAFLAAISAASFLLSRVFRTTGP